MRISKTKRKELRRDKIRRRVRSTVHGMPGRPRLSVFRSNKHIYAQLIDDLDGHTLAAASSTEDGIEGDDRTAESFAVGQRLAERAKEAGIEKAVFDRGGYRYHGRVKALAEGARDGGLTF
jgi:large subunit ribosomal protein L18